MTGPLIAKDSAFLRQATAQWRRDGGSIAFVPTMGALHEGHLSLVELARQHAQRVVVSIFVNPLQFGPKEDLSRYPRPLQADLAALTHAGADLVFLPEPGEMYPPDFSTVVSVKGLSDGLCGAARPGHFDGVATVVAKLLLQVLPDYAVFGEKDYQQLQVIKRLVRDLSIPVSIIPGPIMRESDGLAMSSRNLYLSREERAIAPKIYETLRLMAQKIRDGEKMPLVKKWAEERLLGVGFTRVDYLELCDAQSLKPLERADRPARLLAATVLGTTRLIDNIVVE